MPSYQQGARTQSLKAFAERQPQLTSALLWLLAVVDTLLCFSYQDKTGPTYPLEGDLQTVEGTVQFKFLCSVTIGTDLKIMLLDLVPSGVTGYVEYRRNKSNDESHGVRIFRVLSSRPCRVGAGEGRRAAQPR
jgi:hypothetical protein